ncbi:hypothetical protein N9L68_08065, partial [bacterium]|nr:hypothetical protein [bacterium]
AGKAAVAQTLQYLTEVMNTYAPWMYHLNALLHNPDWTAVLRAIIGGIAQAAVSGDKLGKWWRVRAGVRKFGHIYGRVMQSTKRPSLRARASW